MVIVIEKKILKILYFENMFFSLKKVFMSIHEGSNFSFISDFICTFIYSDAYVNSVSLFIIVFIIVLLRCVKASERLMQINTLIYGHDHARTLHGMIYSVIILYNLQFSLITMKHASRDSTWYNCD